MRKTSQDGGDSTSITSGVENEIKKPCAAVIKNKRNSIKRKVQTLSHESDDAVIEPLLQKEKEKTEVVNQSAKFSMLKSKTDAHSRDSDKDKLLPDNKAKTSGLPEVSLSPNTKENILFKSQPITTATLHNHMNTNVFSSIDTTKFNTTTKNQILVEIDGCKQGGFNPSPLIFTTAKIHTDSKTKQMEPVQVTTVPILSTTEIANTGKIKSMTGVTKVIPGTSDAKTNESFLVSNTTATAGKDSKYNIPKTTSENKIQNSDHDIQNNSSLLLKDTTKPLAVALDSKFSKSGPNKVEDKLSEPQLSSKLGETLKKDYSTKSTPMSHYMDVKSANNVSLPKVPSTESDNITGTSKKLKSDDVITKLDKTSLVKKDIFKQQEVKVDENANANTATISQLISPGVSDVKKSSVDSKKHTDSASKDKISKEKASSSGNKQLPRQKNAIVEETGDSILKSKPSGSENVRYSNITQYSKDIDSVPMKLLRGANDVSNKTLPKTSANNIIDTTNAKITATSIASKSTSSSTTTVATPPSHCTVTTGTMSTTTKPTFTKTTSPDTKSTVIPSSSSATITSKPQMASSALSSVIPSTGYNKVLTSSTTKAAATGVVTQSVATSKTSGAPSVKTVTGDVPSLSTQNVSTPSSVSSLSSMTVKASTTKSMSSAGMSSTSAAKPVTTIPVAKSSASNKKNGPKTNEVNKDSKGLKA